jgi:2,4-dienoyl-CoA reductase-like NADH-dependent reductase (Old Yellow Enzyme family)/thioredoxin reductase
LDDTAPTGFRRLLQPFQIGNVWVRNRIVNTAHFSMLPDPRDMRYLEERAKGGVALMGLPGSAGVRDFFVGPGQPGEMGRWDASPPSPVSKAGIEFYDQLVIPAHRQRAELIHQHGAKCFAQVNHAGASTFWGTVRAGIGPSNVPILADSLVPHALTEEEIEQMIIVYAHGIRRAREAGIDAAEIHGAHGYLVTQFMSSYFNQREDKWGGSRENRVRFPLAIIAAARKMVGDDFPIGIRIGYEGTGSGRGITAEELVEIAKLLAPHVTYISVSCGNNSGMYDSFDGSYISPWYREPAYNAPAAASVKKAVSVPVFVTGRIADASIAESLLAEGAADMIGMVRGLIADPEFPNKLMQGKAGHVRMCLGLSECHHSGRYLKHVTCAVNAAAGREAELAIIPAQTKKTVLVIGAGPAGLETARVAAMRGHKVYLCDRSTAIGGMPRLLAKDPNRRNLLDHSVYFETALAELDVEFVLGHEVEAEDIATFEADSVVIATGGTPLIPHLPGIGQANVVLALDVLRGKATVGKHAVVVGGTEYHVGAPTMAEYLADRGHTVDMISEQVDFTSGAEDVTRYTLLKRLRLKAVRISQATRLIEVTDGPVVVDMMTGETRLIEGATVVLACGLVPDDRLYRALNGRVPDLHLIGDALAPRRIMHATIEAARVGGSL